MRVRAGHNSYRENRATGLKSALNGLLEYPPIVDDPIKAIGRRIMGFGLVLALFLGIGEGVAVADQTQLAGLDTLLDGLYQIEGGAKASVPFGLINDHWCVEAGPGACRYYAREMVLVHWRRYQASHDARDWPTYLSNKWAPIGVANDPHGLNRNHAKNLRAYLAKHGGMGK